jgi:hypothetical protein
MPKHGDQRDAPRRHGATLFGKAGLGIDEQRAALRDEVCRWIA